MDNDLLATLPEVTNIAKTGEQICLIFIRIVNYYLRNNKCIIFVISILAYILEKLNTE